MDYATLLAQTLRRPDERERDTRLQQSVMTQPYAPVVPDHMRPGGHALETPLLAPDDLIGSGLGKFAAKALTAPMLLGATFPLMSRPRLDRLLEESAYSMNDKAKMGLAAMTPRQFLASTTPSAEAQEQIIKEAGRFDPFKFNNQQQHPFVNLDHPFDEVVGHEGRHRLASLIPYTDDVPVGVYAEKGMPGKNPDVWDTISGRRHSGQDFGSLGRGMPLRTGEITPLSYATDPEELAKMLRTVDVPLKDIGISLKPEGTFATPENIRAFNRSIPRGPIPRPPAKPADVDLPLNMSEQERKLAIAQANAAMPVERGGLGLPPGNTAQDRAAAMGMQDFYHGSKQDITDSFKPGYDDGLGFLTPDPKFASQWIGKGKHGSRLGDEAARERREVSDITRNIQRETFDNRLTGLQGTDPEFHRIYDEMTAARKAKERAQLGGVGEDQLHSAVYPTKFAPQKTFHPEQNMDDMADYFRSKGVSPVEQQYFQRGNYMTYETPAVVEYLKKKGYDSMMLKESDDVYTTMAAFHPERIRSRFAAFDPLRRNEPDMLGNIDPDLMKYLAGGSAGAALTPFLIDALRTEDQP
jgi:hypothetical protein